VRQTVKPRSTPGDRKPRARTYCFNARINEAQKLLIQRAADLEGRTMTDFVLDSARSAAERVIEKHAAHSQVVFGVSGQSMATGSA
jgi:uncharacterized protein (DUF1778 family)